MDTKKIVEKINESILEARNTIRGLSDDEIIELRAELEASKTHFGKWMNSFMVFFAGVLAILALKPDFANRCVMIILLLTDVAALVAHGVVESRNANKVRALSILNDCCRRRERTQDIEISDDVAIERYEDLERRQRNERRRNLPFRIRKNVRGYF